MRQEILYGKEPGAPLNVYAMGLAAGETPMLELPVNTA
jgi:hypothetical protein